MKPNADYSTLAATAVFDPVSTLAGVASPVYDAAGNFILQAMNVDIDPKDAASQLRDDLQGLVKYPHPALADPRQLGGQSRVPGLQRAVLGDEPGDQPLGFREHLLDPCFGGRFTGH